MDNHDSHIGIDIIEMARANGLSIITFPPHTSHKLQPLDVTVYGPLMCHYQKAMDEWNLSHPGSRIAIYDLPECFGRAFFRDLSFDNIASGFRKSGIWPLNSDVFSDDDFLAATIFSNSSIVHPQTDDGAPILANGDVISATTDDNQPEALTAYSSFAELTKIQLWPKRKAGDQSKPCSKRAVVGCKLITSTPEKEAALEKLKSKNPKSYRPKKKSAAVKKFVPPLFMRVQMITMMMLKTTFLTMESRVTMKRISPKWTVVQN